MKTLRVRAWYLVSVVTRGLVAVPAAMYVRADTTGDIFALSGHSLFPQKAQMISH
jgi:hypothetical protein